MFDKVKFQVYLDAAGEWRWRAKSKNYKIVADGSEGYQQRSNAVQAVERFVGYFGIKPDEIVLSKERFPRAPQAPGQ